jgi:hypothetical protein
LVILLLLIIIVLLGGAPILMGLFVAYGGFMMVLIATAAVLMVGFILFYALGFGRKTGADAEPMWIKDKKCVSCPRLIQRVQRKCPHCGAANPIVQ